MLTARTSWVKHHTQWEVQCNIMLMATHYTEEVQSKLRQVEILGRHGELCREEYTLHSHITHTHTHTHLPEVGADKYKHKTSVHQRECIVNEECQTSIQTSRIFHILCYHGNSNNGGGGDGLTFMCR